MKIKKIPIYFLILVGVSASCFFIFRGPVFGQYNQNGPEIDQLNQQIQSKKDQINTYKEKQQRYSQAIQEAQNQKLTLSNELAVLGNRLAQSQLDISGTQTEIDQTNLEIKKTNIEIGEKNDEIAKEKGQIAVALELVYKQDQTGDLEIMLMNNSLSEFLNQEKYLEDINSQLAKNLGSLKQSEADLESEKTDLNNKHGELTQLQANLEQEQQNMQNDQSNKTYLLEQTNYSEARFQSLLNEAAQQELQAENDVSGLEKTVRDKLSTTQREKLEMNPGGLIWPVPKNTITTYFHDPNYPFRYLFEHPAIDIRAAQGTPIRAAASGYVARAHDGGMNYSYIMLIHANGISTVYGHVSKILVTEDEYVVQGQIIGLSGGLPGSPGAGPYTTGPHLHFEVRLDGIPVNPLDGYLQY